MAGQNNACLKEYNLTKSDENFTENYVCRPNEWFRQIFDIFDIIWTFHCLRYCYVESMESKEWKFATNTIQRD